MSETGAPPPAAEHEPLEPTRAPGIFASGRFAYAALMCIMILLVPVTLWSVSRDPVLAERLASWVPATAPAPRPFDLDGLRRADLPLGAPFPKAGAAGQVRRLVGAKANGCMLVTLGSCSGCMKFDFGAWSRLARDRGLTLVGVTNAPPDRLAEVSRTMPDNLALVSAVGLRWRGSHESARVHAG